MRFSIATPTHNLTYLNDLYQSLLEQHFTDWEWVLCLNGGVSVPEFSDPRVRIIVAVDQSGVGALKRFTCDQCLGEYIVEVDHDDILTDDALTKIDAAINESNADFLYSDSAEFRATGESNVYSEKFGWEHYKWPYKDHEYTINKTFPLTARSLCEIFYAPNHVRVWRADTYRDVGGHDASLQVCDDFDLVVRTYLSGAKFHLVPEPLYLYRFHLDGGNTFLKHNGDIQTTQQVVGDKYRHQLVQEWCKREGLPMYDLGGAHNKTLGYLSVDLVDADIKADIRHGLPFGDNTVGCLRAYDFLEHVPSCGIAQCDTGTGHHMGCTVKAMNEIYRVLVPGGWFLTSTPSTDGRGAWMDPTHASGWSVPNSFFYHTRSYQQRFIRGLKTRFQMVRATNGFPTPWHETHNIVYGNADMVALKDQRCPGIKEI